MKKAQETLILIILFSSYFSFSQNVFIPDENFKNKLIEEGIDTNNDGEISYSEAANVEGHLTVWNCGIADLTGIKAFINIKYLYAGYNELNEIDISGMSELKYVKCTNNNISDYNIQDMVLKRLEIDYNSLTHIHSLQNVSSQFNCNNNLITEIDFEGSNELLRVECDSNLLIEVNLQNIPIRRLNCSYNQISSINIQGSTITSLLCDNNLLSELNLTSSIFYLNCANNPLNEINLQGTNLEYLDCSGNNLSNLNLSGINLALLYCNNNQLSELQFNGPIMELECNNNLIESLVVEGAESIKINHNNLRYLDVSACFELTHLDITYNSNFEQLCVYSIPVKANILDWWTPEYDVFVCNPPKGDSFLAGQYLNCFHHYDSLNYAVLTAQYDLNVDGFPDIELWRESEYNYPHEYFRYYVKAINNSSEPGHSISSTGFEKWETLVPISCSMNTQAVLYYKCEVDWDYYIVDWDNYGHYYLLRTISANDTTYTWFRFNDLDDVYMADEIRLDEIASWRKYGFPELLGNDTTINIDKTISIEAAPGYKSYYWSTRDTSNPISINGDDFGIGEWPVHVFVNDSNYFYTDYLTLEVIDQAGTDEETIPAINPFPNPIIDKLYISNPNSLELEIIIKNINGKECFHIYSTSGIAEIDFSQMANGVYICTISQKTDSKSYKLLKI